MAMISFGLRFVWQENALMEAWSDAMIVAVVPGIVEVAKRAGLPVRWSGVAAIAAACALVALRDLARGAHLATATIPAVVAWWVLEGIMLGLAAAGLYSQARQARGSAGERPGELPGEKASEQG